LTYPLCYTIGQMISTRGKRERKMKNDEQSGGSTGAGGCSGRCAGLGCPGWWRAVPKEERALLWSHVRMLESAKRSRVSGVVRAARKWESCLSCFMKVRLLNTCPGRRAWAGGGPAR
jgi:hypothetical protein